LNNHIVIPATPDPEGIDLLHGVRAGTANREECIAQLSRAYAAGFFDDDEYDRRVTLAQKVYSQSVLAKLLADLPSTFVVNQPAVPRLRTFIAGTRKFFKTDAGVTTLFGIGAIASIVMAVAVPFVALHNHPQHSTMSLIVAVLAIILGIISAIVNIVGVVTTAD
jgi:hypothetical protein